MLYNHRSFRLELRARRECAFFIALFLAPLEVCEAMHRIDRIETRAQIRRFRRRGMLARAVSAADSARSYLNRCQKIDESPSVVQTFKFGLVRRASVDSFFSSPPLASFRL